MSKSCRVRLLRASISATATVGAISRPSPWTKSTADTWASRSQHSGSWPCAWAHSWLASRQAEAPSVSGVELPAVRVPRPDALSKAGLSVASLSIEVSGRRMLSRETPRKLTTRSSKNPRS